MMNNTTMSYTAKNHFTWLLIKLYSDSQSLFWGIEVEKPQILVERAKQLTQRSEQVYTYANDWGIDLLQFAELLSTIRSQLARAMEVALEKLRAARPWWRKILDFIVAAVSFSANLLGLLASCSSLWVALTVH